MELKKPFIQKIDLVLAGPRRGVVQPCLHRKALIKIVSNNWATPLESESSCSSLFHCFRLLS
ncbi:hypothetical protein NC651_010020 [Populus alba x Populus x berolinensis]|nr:hypothetical protein NC651_010020 [Populus alba x Populus x berolinensis]